MSGMAFYLVFFSSLSLAFFATPERQIYRLIVSSISLRFMPNSAN